MRVAILSERNLKSTTSSTHYYLANALARNGAEVVAVAPRGSERRRWIPSALRSLWSTASKDLSPLQVARQEAPRLNRLLARTECDVILAPMGARYVPFLETSRPIVYLSDATFPLLKDYYPSFSSLSPRVCREREELERRSHENADLIVYSSEWAAQSAEHDYQVPPNKIRVILFGANFAPPDQHIDLEARFPLDECRLLFIAIDWERKGGDIAVEVVQELVRSGQPAKLTAVGASRPKRPEHTTFAGFLNKDKARDRQKLLDLMRTHHFLIFPTRADCSPHVICEAHAFGLPVITTDTGGVAEMLVSGETGYALPIDASAREYAERIRGCFSDSTYRKMAMQCYAHYAANLNWDQWARMILNEFDGLKRGGS